MAQSYTRQSSFSDGDTITAALFNNEYNQLVNAFTYSSSSASSTGHRHDGTAGHGGNIHTIGDLDFLNKIVADSTNNRWGVFVEVSSAAVEQIRIQDGAIVPVTDNDIDLGTSSLEFKDAYFDGTITTDLLTVSGATNLDGAIQVDNTITVGVDDTGYDVKFFGDTASAYMLWDTSADDLVLAGAAGLDVAGDIDVDGTSNLDNTDIDGTLAVDGTTISLDATTSLNIDNSNTSNGITIGTATSGVPISIGHTTSEVTVNDNLTVTGTLTLGSGAELTEAELEMLDGITAGTVAASKAVVVDSNKDAASFRNITLTGELDAATLDISGDADIDGTLEADAYTVDGTALNEYIADTVGAMVSSNTESGITVAYEDGDNTLDFTVGTLNQDTTGTADNITVSANNSTDETVYPIFVDGATGSQGAESDTGLTYNPSSGLLTISGELDAGSLDISGNADIDGTLEADAYTVDGTALNEYIADTVGAMVGSNTETNIAVTYEDGDNTLDFVIGTLNQDTTGTADNITVSANNTTDETVYPIFVDGATGSQGAESDTGLNYNPSTGMLTTTGVTATFTGNITGNVTGNTSGTAATVTGAAQSNITSLGTLTTLTVDNVIVNGTTIGHTSDTDLITLADGNVTIAGELDLTTLDVSGDADIDGTLEADAITVGGTALASVIAGTTVSNATLASTVTVSDSTANTNFPVVFHDESNALLDDTGALRYNPSTGELLVPKLTVAGTTTTADTVTMEASNAIIFEGATADANETTLSIVDPTSDHTQYLVNQGGYIPVLAAATTTQISSTPAELNLLDGSSANTVVNSKAVIYGSSGELAGTLSTAAQTNITSLGTLSTLTVDDITINGSTISDGGDLTLDIGGDVEINVDGGDINFKDGSDFIGKFKNSSNNFVIKSVYQDADLIIQGNDGGSDVTALTLDMSDAGTATFNHDVVVGGNISLGDASGATITMNDTDGSEEDFAFVLGANALSMRKTSNSNDIMRLDLTNERVGIGTASPSTNLHIYSTADNAPHLLLENYQNADTDDAPVIELYTNDQTTGGIGDNTDVGVIRFTGDEKDGGTKETYAEIRGVAHDPGQGASNKGNLSFFVQAAGDLNETLTLDEKNVGIGTATPAKLLSLSETADGTKLRITRGGLCEWDFSIGSTSTLTGVGSGALELLPQNAGTTNEFAIGTAGSTAPLFHLTNSQNYFAKKVGIGTTSPSYNTHIQSTSSETTLAVQSNLSPTGSSVGGRLRLQLGAQSNSGSGNADTSAGDFCGQVIYEGQGTDYSYQAGSVNSLVTTGDGSDGRSNQGAALTFGTIDVGATSQVEKMRLTEDGKLGIGVTSPNHKLEVNDSGVASKYDANNHVAIRGLSGGQYIQFSSQGALGFVQVDTYPNSSAAEIARLQSNGFSIGSAAISGHADQMLRVAGSKNGYAMLLNNTNSTINQPQGLLIDTSAVASDNNSQVFLKCADSSAARMQVYTDGDVWTSDAGTLSSDETLKTDIVDATSKLSDVMNLRVRNFKWKTDYHPVKQHKHIGFIAQELETVFPSLVVENNIARDDEEPNMKKGIKQGGLIPILVKSIQELKTELDAAKARITELENN